MMNAIWSLLILTGLQWHGYLAGYYSFSEAQRSLWSTWVGAADLGATYEAGGSRVAVTLHYFDLVPGALETWRFAPYFSEAYLELPLSPGVRLRLGRQIFDFDRGVLLHDYYSGEDALRLVAEAGGNRADLFLIRVRETEGKDSDLLGGRIQAGHAVLYGALGTWRDYPAAPLWLGGILTPNFPGLDLRLELCQLADTGGRRVLATVELDFSEGPIRMGLGHFLLPDNWQAPLGYAYIHDDFYNGWGSGFGEAIPWALLSTTNFASLVTDLPRSAHSIFFLNPHNLRVTNLNLQWTPSEHLSLRFDVFLHRLYAPFLAEDGGPPRKEIGREWTLVLHRTVAEGAILGFAGGVLFPGEVLKASDGIEEPVMVARLWVERFFP